MRGIVIAIVGGTAVWLIIGALMVWLLHWDIPALMAMGALLTMFGLLGYLGVRYPSTDLSIGMADDDDDPELDRMAW